ncbi:MAG TPA: hypothetical protein VJ937_04305 [Salinivirga sp.]|uniref:hypothetical protein n=1 Tax=Salinivirga sp. TaxID=1970192 RepID=UPI002B4A2503|nr:hypothetical protein [Salinivirga sp.]HKK58674.1 hypothetical protein [Salinivirga sp.]
MSRKLILILGILLINMAIYGQQKSAQQYISNIAEELQENEVAESTIEEISNTLTYWSETKPNINTITAETLLGYQLINPMQAAEMQDYIKNNGDLLSPYELIYMPSFTRQTAQTLMLFFTFGKEEEEKKDLREYLWGRHEIMTQYNRFFEQKQGYKDGDYEGKPGKVYFRYQYNRSQQYSAGITAEKDPGEAFFKGSNNHGFDYYSMHIFLTPGDRLKTMAIGDYQVTMGQGLICGQGIWGGKNSATTQIRNTRQGFKPYRSATEYGFMRGAGVEGSLKNINAGLFASYQDIDATVDTLDKPVISSLSATGLHRTTGEQAKENSVKEFIAGSFINGRFGNLNINLNSIFTNYEHTIQKSGQLYDLYDPEGQKFANLSGGYTYQLHRFTFFGEVAWSKNNHWANLHGLSFYPSESAGLALLYRNYQKEFTALHGYALGEGSSVQNEEGFYFGLEWLPFKYTKVNLYADLFRFPWLRYGEKAPTDGSEYLINIDYAPQREIDIQTRLKYEKKSTTVSDHQYADLVYGELYKWRIQAKMDFTKEWSGQARLAFSHFKQDTANYDGWLLFYEHFYDPPESKLSASFRINIFDVEDYTARIYTYERDVLYSFSVPSFQETGVRYYLNAKWDITEYISLYARIEQTTYLHKDEISSGNELIEGSERTAIHTKLRIKF